MEFYNGKDGLEIMRLITEGHSVDEAIAIVNPQTFEIEVSEEVEDFCAALDSNTCPECGARVDDPDAFAGLCSQECYWNVFEDTTPYGGF
jgi:uncharacterized protein (UPF0212 family)